MKKEENQTTQKIEQPKVETKEIEKISEENVAKDTKNKAKNVTKKQVTSNKKRFIAVLTFSLVAVIVAYVLFRGSYLEMLEIGENYISVYWQNIKYTSIALVINFAFIYFAIYYTNVRIKKGLKEFFDKENKKMPKILNKSVAFIGATLVSAVSSSIILNKAMLCFNMAQFGVTDPVFGIDIGFFVFIEPFIKLILWYLIIVVLALLIYKTLYYIITLNVFLNGVERKDIKNSKFVKQITTSVMILGILIGCLILLTSFNIETEKFMTLKNDSTTYSLYGAGFVDVKIKVWGYRIAAIVVIMSVYIGIKYFKQGNRRKLIGAILTVPTYLVVLFIVMAGVQSVYVNANEYDKEKGYIEANINATKEAYGIKIDENSLNETEAITVSEVSKYKNVLNNIAIVDSDLVLKDLNNGQTAKGYYSYRTTQIGKYSIDGKETLVYISPREIVNNTQTYDSKTYEHTHGYGAIVTSATTTKENGNLDNIQKEFDNSDEKIAIAEPRIYYGIETNDTVVTKNTVSQEFDYPVLDSSTAENKENEYNGKSGLSLNFIDRIILSIKEGDLKLAFSGNVTNESKILINRNIIKRAEVVMPYLKYDTEPYMVVTEDGKLVWVLDAYTISNNYPYSQTTVLQETQTTKLELNYIRNSVKVLIDAYDGTIKFYITDRTDPIAMAYYNIYQDLFENIDEKIPTDISSHFVYPKYLYNIQADIITRYHNIQPDVLYREDDVWDIATNNTGKISTKAGTQMKPYYTTIKTTDSDKEELGLILPYTPYGKQNLISYISGVCDNDGNAKLKIYKYQANSSVLGPMQLDTQIEEDETIQKEIATLNVTGTKITKNMIVVPLDNNLLYVEPIYTQYINEKNSLPTLKKVVVASGTKVAIGNNLKEALSNLVSKYAVNLEIENTDTIEDMINTIIKANRNLTTSNESNDWEMIGKDVKKLQGLINKLETLVEEENEKKVNEQINSTNTNAKTTNTINDKTNSIDF